MTEKPSAEQAVRLLRAKAYDLENNVLAHVDAATDIALIAGLLADHIERTDPLRARTDQG